jgi:uncharacterized BrkB/YihY/UPF0761 family membrane protein
MTERLTRRDFTGCHRPRPPLGGAFQIRFRADCVHLTLSLAFTTVLFATIFKILPDKPVEWEEVWLGAAVAALLFTVGKQWLKVTDR